MSVSPEVAELCKSARALISRRQYDEAIIFLEESDVPDGAGVSPEFHEVLAAAHFLRGDDAGAIEHFVQVTRLDPTRASAYINLGAVYNRAGEYQRAIEILRRGLQFDRNSCEGYYNLGIAYRKLNQFAMAIPAYREAIRINPRMADAYQNLGNVYLQLHNYQQAIQQFKKALELNPKFERAQRGLEKAQAAQEAARQSLNPFGRLVDQSGTQQSVPQWRVLNDSERDFDRTELYELTQAIQTEAHELADLIRSELEPQLRGLHIALSKQEQEPRTAVEMFRGFLEVRGQCAPVVKRLSRSLQRLREHDARMR